MKISSILIIAGVLLAGILHSAAQNCGCPPNLCCSQWGYCGTGDDYCGAGCRENCPPPPPPNNVSIADIVTDEFFNGIIRQASPSCVGIGFYTRATFLEATEKYPLFAREGTEEDSRRTIAAFFAHVTHETGHFCYIEEIDGPLKNYCDSTNYPCNPTKGYYGRGPLQLSWNYNYILAGNSIGFDGLNNPDIVATNPLISFETALWFWMQNVQSIFLKQGFGASIRAINSIECYGGNTAAVSARVEYYSDYCGQFNVAEGDNLRC